MIEALKKYPKTWKRFQEYVVKFNQKNNHGIMEVHPEDFYFEGFTDSVNFNMPPQFLVGCLMEFLGENGINISVHSVIAECVVFEIYKKPEPMMYPNRTSGFMKAFEILEERI